MGLNIVVIRESFPTYLHPGGAHCVSLKGRCLAAAVGMWEGLGVFLHIGATLWPQAIISSGWGKAALGWLKK